MKRYYYYRQSYARFVACNGRDELDYFTGSSINRRKKNERKVNHSTDTGKAGPLRQTEDIEILNDASYAIWKGEITKRCHKRRALAAKKSKQRAVHMLSTRSKTKIRDKMHSFYRSYRGNKAFATLSFISSVTDSDAIAILNRFLTELRKMYKHLHYIWVAERQENNAKYRGNIHFHVMLSTYVNIKRLNSLWVLQQYNAGVKYEGYSDAEILQRHLEGTMGEILNPFDVKPVRSVNGLAYYLTMYVTKNSSEFECACWHCSRSISELYTAQLVSKEKFQESLDVSKNYSVNKKTGEVFEAKMYVHDYGLVVNIYNKDYYVKNLQEMEMRNHLLLTNQIFKDSTPRIDVFEYHYESVN